MKEFTKYYSSPVGVIRITATNEGITGLDFVKKEGTSDQNIPSCLKLCLRQLDEYFAGKRKDFDLNLSVEGTDFQTKVWNKLKQIPYGQTLSYGDIAKRLKKPNASRAVGMANNKNKISIIIPCHRVIGHDGSLTGYASGVWRKKWLLEHEKNYS